MNLTDIEYRSVVELAINAGRVVTHQQLLRNVWGGDENGDLRPIRTVISSIRRKLADNAEDPDYIQTENRVGYSMPRTDASGNRE